MKNIVRKVINRIRRYSWTYVSLNKQNNKLRQFRNKHSGESCIIMGAGPSLNEIPHDFLEKFVVIGTNLSFKYHTPDYWVVIDAQYSWMEEGRQLCTQKNIPAFINWLWAPEKPEEQNPNEVWLHAHRISTEQSPKNTQLKKQLISVYNNPRYIEKKGFTSVNSVVPEGAIPLAAYMGFDKIYLAGVDFYTPRTGNFHFIDDTHDDIKRIEKLRTRLQKEDNSKKDLFDYKRWPIELVSQTKIGPKVFNLSQNSSVKHIPKISYKDIILHQ